MEMEKEKFKEYEQNKVIEKNTKGEWAVKYKLYLNSSEEAEEKQKVPRSLIIKERKNSQGQKLYTTKPVYYHHKF